MTTSSAGKVAVVTGGASARASRPSCRVNGGRNT